MTGPRLSIIPARAATDRALKPRDLQVLCVLGRHTDDLGWCTRSQVKMAAEMGCARSTVFEAIERLMTAGYLERHVVEQSNGRDAPHFYRVILDPVHNALSELQPEPDGDDADGQDPADQPAPPAGISAPPAGPGPAPKNDPFRTKERERAREVLEETPISNAGATDDPRKFEARVKRLAISLKWEGFENSSTAWAVAQFAKLSDAERAMAEARAAAYVQHCGKKALSIGTYFLERKWLDLPASVIAAVEATPPVLAAPFGKAWGARRMTVFLAGCGPLPAPKGFSATLIERGGEVRRREELSRQATYGFPEVSRMHQLAADGKGWTLRPETEPSEAVLALMAPCRVGSDDYRAWKALHEERGWPWLPDPGRQEWVYFPAGGPEALGAFEQAMRGNHDALKAAE